MNLIKVKAIVIKEVTYKENDKIITILTDELGKLSCVARGAKKTNSPILASSQYLVYSEFILYKSKNFYYINSANVINTFYNLRIDFDKLNVAFELTKILNFTIYEDYNTNDVLRLFLNTLYVIQNFSKSDKLIINIFKIKLFSMLGFSPDIHKCANCLKNFEVLDNTKESKKKLDDLNNKIYYDFINNRLVCKECVETKKIRNCIELSYTTLVAIKYVIMCDIKKLFSFELKDVTLRQFNTFGQAFADCILNNM